MQIMQTIVSPLLLLIGSVVLLSNYIGMAHYQKEHPEKFRIQKPLCLLSILLCFFVADQTIVKIEAFWDILLICTFLLVFTHGQ